MHYLKADFVASKSGFRDHSRASARRSVSVRSDRASWDGVTGRRGFRPGPTDFRIRCLFPKPGTALFALFIFAIKPPGSSGFVLPGNHRSYRNHLKTLVQALASSVMLNDPSTR